MHTVVRPIAAPKLIRPANHGCPVALNASASGASIDSELYFCIPVTTIATATYSVVQMTSEPRMPRGTSRFGLRVSSAAVATTSKPMKAKKTTDAAVKMPMTPKLEGAQPNISWISGALRFPPASTACDLGMNGL